MRLTAEEVQGKIAGTTYGSVGSARAESNVALLRLHGPIMSRAGSNMTMSGASDPQQFAARVRAAADDPDIGRIVISIDSPGGTVSGTRTAADAVAYARARKEVVAVADDMAASAAYWIGAQATTFVADPGATVGSIGVVMAIKDTSGKNANEGVQTHVLRSGPQKALGQPGEVITDDTLAHYREQLMVFHEQFVEAVAEGRGMAVEQARTLATGRTWIGSQAVDVGLADHVGTLQQAINGEFSGSAGLAVRPAALSPAAQVETITGGDMDPKILAMLGLSADATPEQIEAAIREQRVKAAATERTNLLAGLGLTEESDKPADLGAYAAQARDGAAYRQAQLDRLHALTITVEGNDERGIQAADDAREVYAGQSIERINAQIVRLEAKRDTLPAGPLGKRGDSDTKPPKALPMSAFGLVGRR
ncbi:S49 family peptidase [Deinococcus navajonensis]|uniref:S49 family peptidase n=1 Tax=Deinococcus navajonensis TaxID=309884 RepID=A0ABV8XW22_9DEIO